MIGFLVRLIPSLFPNWPFRVTIEIALLLKSAPVNIVRTVSDTKRDFYTHHTRPINTLYRRVVEELMVEMHLLSVNVDFQYDPIYGYGVVSTFDRFMQGYQPEQDRISIFNSICQAVQDNPQRYQQDAQRLEGLATTAGSNLVSGLAKADSWEGTDFLHEVCVAIAANPKFKYSRLLAIGLHNLVEKANPEAVKDDQQRINTLKPICEALKLPFDKVQKDLELYRSNLEKMAQAQIVMADALAAERKKREQRLQEKANQSVSVSDPS